MKDTKRDVTKMTVEGLRREIKLRQAWIRDVSGVNRARVMQIEQELANREVPSDVV